MGTTAHEGEAGAAGLCRRYVEEFLNTGDGAVAEDVLAEGVVAHQLGVETDHVGRDAVVDQALAFRNAVPDWRLAVDDVVAADDRVMLRATARGTPERPWGRMVPTGKSFEVAAFFAFRVSEGRIVEQWNLANAMGIGTQFGLMPPTPRALAAMLKHKLGGRGRSSSG
jgi:predicted ester cyclase